MNIEEMRSDYINIDEYHFVKCHMPNGIKGLSEDQIQALLRLKLSPVRVEMRSKLNSLTSKNRWLKSQLKIQVEQMGAHWSDNTAKLLEQRTAEYREGLKEIHWLQLLLSTKQGPEYQESNSITMN